MKILMKKKRKNDNNKEDKQNKPQNQEQKSKEKDGKHEEMSIESGVPDLESKRKSRINPKKNLR